MEHTDKDEAQKNVENKAERSSDPAVQNTSPNTRAGVDGAPADRDAGSLDHGEMGGNFNEDIKEETTS